MGTESPELIVLDARSSQLRETLEAHLEAARMRRIFELFMFGSFASGVPLWISAAWPARVPLGLRHMALVFWVFWAAGAVWSGLAGRRWRRRIARTIAP